MDRWFDPDTRSGRGIKDQIREIVQNFTPAVSNASKKEMREKLHDWPMHLRPDKSLEDLSKMFNPLIRGWYNYFKNFYKSETYSVLNYRNLALVYWARGKHKKLRGHRKGAEQWFRVIAIREP